MHVADKSIGMSRYDTISVYGKRHSILHINELFY